MFLNLVLAHRFLGIWCLLLSFVLLGRRAPAGNGRGPAPTPGPATGHPGEGTSPAPPRGSPASIRTDPVAGDPAAPAPPGEETAWPPWVAQGLLVVAGWAWAVVLARSLPPWRVTLSWAGEGLVLFDSRVPLWAAVGLWGVWRGGPRAATDLAPYALAAALLADPGAVGGSWLAGGFQTFTAGEGLPSLAVLALPLVAFWSARSGGEALRHGEVGCTLVAACYLGIVPALVLCWAARSLPGSGQSWRAAGLQALIVAALIEWLETSALGVGTLPGSLAPAALFTLGRILPIVGKMVS